MTWKPVQWLQNSIRYQFLHKKFDARAESLVGQEAVTESHIVTLDTSYQPTDSLFLNLSLSQQNITTKTAAAADTSVNRAPEFDGDVTSALFSASYAPSEELSLFSSMNYSFSDNFQDFTLSALPLAVTNNRFNTEVGLRWAPKNKAWVVEPKYAYYDYNTHSESESGDYRAHAGWVDVSFDW
jgi:hypothetical protein